MIDDVYRHDTYHVPTMDENPYYKELGEREWSNEVIQMNNEKINTAETYTHYGYKLFWYNKNL